METPQHKETDAERSKREILAELAQLKNDLREVTVPLEHREDGALTKIRIGTNTIDCSKSPITQHGTQEQILRLHRMVKQLDASPRYKTRTADETVTLSLIDDVRLSCALTNGKKKEELVCTAFDTFIVTANDVDIRTEQEKKDGPILKAASHRTRVFIGQDQPENDEEKKLYDAFEGEKEKWSALMSESGTQQTKAEEIDAREHARSLQNEKTGATAYEFEGNWNFGSVIREYAPKDGLTRRERYKDSTLIVETRRPNGSVESRVTLDAERKLILSTVYNEKEEMVESLHEIHDKGVAGMRYVVKHQPKEQIYFPITAANGKETFIDPLDPQLKKEDGDRLIASIDSTARFDLFEELYYKQLSTIFAGEEEQKPLLYALWKKGASLYGLTQKITALEERMHTAGIKDFRVECFPRKTDRGAYGLMRQNVSTLEWCSKEISMYPTTLIANSRLGALCVVCNPKTGNSIFSPAGFYAYQENRMVLNTVGTSKKDAQTLHHEWYHLLDNRSGSVTTDNEDWIERFHGLRTLPDGRDVYGRGLLQKVERDGNAWSTLGEREEGFSTGYGMQSPDEDQATVAEALFDPKRAYNQESLARMDNVLQQKIANIKRRYYILSEGKMDDRFWEDIKDGTTVDENYWKKREDAGDFATEKHTTLSKYMAYERSLPVNAFAEVDGWNLRKDLPRQERLEKLCLETLIQNPYNEGAIKLLNQLVDARRVNEQHVPLLTKALPALQERLRLLEPIDREASLYDLIAEAQKAQNQPEEVSKTYREGIDTVPRSYALKKSLLSHLRTLDAKGNEAEITSLMEKCYEQSRSKSDCLDLCEHYQAIGQKEKVLPQLQEFMNRYPFTEESASIRQRWEKEMITAGKSAQIEATYNTLAKNNPKRAPQCALLIAYLYAYRLENTDRAIEEFRKALLQWPTDQDVSGAVSNFVQQQEKLHATDTEKLRAFRTKMAAIYKQLVIDFNRIDFARDYTSLVEKDESPDAYRFVYDRFKDDVLKSLRDRTYNEKSFQEFKNTLMWWNAYPQKERGPGIERFEELLNAMGDNPIVENELVQDVFDTFILQRESRDPARSLRLCEQYQMLLKRSREERYKVPQIERQSWYLRTIAQQGTWIPMDGGAVCASVKEEPGVLYLKLKDEYIRQERWVGSMGGLDWTGNPERRTKKINADALPLALRPTQKK